MRLDRLHRAYPSLHPFGVVNWVPVLSNIKTVTGCESNRQLQLWTVFAGTVVNNYQINGIQGWAGQLCQITGAYPEGGGDMGECPPPSGFPDFLISVKIPWERGIWANVPPPPPVRISILFNKFLISDPMGNKYVDYPPFEVTVTELRRLPPPSKSQKYADYPPPSKMILKS